MARHVPDQLLHAEPAQALILAKAWSAWEAALTERRASSPPSPASASDAAVPGQVPPAKPIYLAAQCFFPPQGALAGCAALGDMPVALLHVGAWIGSAAPIGLGCAPGPAGQPPALD
jgi:hypothetical protein